MEGRVSPPGASAETERVSRPWRLVGVSSFPGPLNFSGAHAEGGLSSSREGKASDSGSYTDSDPLGPRTWYRLLRG